MSKEINLETKRLILRVPRKEDWKDIVEGIGDLEVSKTLSSVPYPYKKKDALWWVNKTRKSWKNKKDKSRGFLIELKSESKVIGGTGFHNIKWDIGSAESGSWIAKKYWRKGYITEAKIAINDWAFNKLKFQRLQSGAFVTNKASNGMSTKYGYRFVGTLKRAVKAKSTGKVHDRNIYELLKEDWKINRNILIKELNSKKD